MIEQKQPRVRAGKIGGQDAGRVARAHGSGESVAERFELSVEQVEAARWWYASLLEKGRKQKHRVQRKNRPAAWTAKLDKLCGDLVRARGYCEADDPLVEHELGLKCSGPLQWCHGESRRFFRSRWEPDTHFSLCAAHHTYFTHHPIDWSEFMQAFFEDRYARLRSLRSFEVPKGAARREWMEQLEADLRRRFDG